MLNIFRQYVQRMLLHLLLFLSVKYFILILLIEKVILLQKTVSINPFLFLKIGLIGLVEEEWIDTLSTLDPDDVTFVDFVEAGVHLSGIVRQLVCENLITLCKM